MEISYKLQFTNKKNNLWYFIERTYKLHLINSKFFMVHYRERSYKFHLTKKKYIYCTIWRDHINYILFM